WNVPTIQELWWACWIISWGGLEPDCPGPGARDPRSDPVRSCHRNRVAKLGVQLDTQPSDMPEGKGAHHALVFLAGLDHGAHRHGDRSIRRSAPGRGAAAHTCADSLAVCSDQDRSRAGLRCLSGTIGAKSARG